MIDEAIGKILGMAMAYLASAMGMFVAYLNYRKRIVKAERLMTPVAWAVILLTLLATAGGVLVVAQLAAAPAAEEMALEPEEAIETAAAVESSPPPPREPEVAKERNRWPWIGILLPALIFLFATVVTAGLHRHFSAPGTGH